MSASRLLVIALPLWLTLTFAWADPPEPSAELTVLRRCVVDYEHSSTIGSHLYGVFEECLVAPGDRVAAGQLLGRLTDGEIRAEVKLREAEAGSDVEVRLGEARTAQAVSKMRRTEALVRRNASSQEELAEHKLAAEAARLEVEQARHRRRLAAIQLEHAKAVLRTRELVSPHDGVVAAVEKRRGEPVSPRDPVFQIVDTDHLRVTGQVDVTEVWRLAVGRPARVIAEIAGADLPIEREVFSGKVVYIDSRVDPVTRTCKVVVSARNRDRLLRAGLEARVEIEPAPPVMAASEPSAARPVDLGRGK